MYEKHLTTSNIAVEYRDENIDDVSLLLCYTMSHAA